MSLSTCSAASNGTFELCGEREQGGWGLVRLHSFNQGRVISTISSTTCGSRFWQILFHLHPLQLLRGFLHLALAVWAQEDAKIHGSELATGQPLLHTYPKIEICRFSDPRRLTSARKVFDLSFVFRLQAFLSTENFALLAPQENEPRFGMRALRLPSCGYEQSKCARSCRNC